MNGYDDWDWCGTRVPGWPRPLPIRFDQILVNPVQRGGLIIPSLPGGQGFRGGM